jgi:Flp pilus assembly protein TadG
VVVMMGVDGETGRQGMTIGSATATETPRPATRAARFRRFLADRAGATAITTGLLAPLVFGAAGLGADAASWYVQRAEL